RVVRPKTTYHWIERLLADASLPRRQGDWEMMRNGMLSLAALLLVVIAGSAQNGGAERDGVIKLVDPERGLAVMAFPSENGIRIFEVPIPQDTKFVTKDGKKIADGLKDPMFKSGNNRITISV